MQINTNGKRNITLDFDAPKKFKLKKDGAEIPYLRTGKNSFRLGRNIDGVLDLEEVIEQPRIVKPMQLKAQQMALVNPNDVLMINQAAQQLEVEQNILNETQKRVEQTQAYLDIQQQRINESVLSVQGLETDNSERITATENGIFNLAGELAKAEGNSADADNYIIGELDEHKTAKNPHGITKETIGLNKVDNTSDLDKPISKAAQSALDKKADKDEIQAIRDELGEYQEKNDRFTNALSNYTGGLAGNQLPDGGLQGQILAKRSDMSGDAEWIDSSVSITVDDELSLESKNPVQNKVITLAVNNISAEITDIESKIPAQASSSNQLADKDFVNSSIATNTATFRGTFNSVAELEAYSGEKDNNDYAFVTGTDQTGNTYYDRYKYNGFSWVYEYRLNNSSFTAAQWASINSGATTQSINQISTNTSNISSLQTSKQDVLTSENAGTDISITAGIQDVLLSGVSPLALTNALGLNYIKALGKCEQNETPTPSNPVDIVCNNGVLKVRNKSGLPLEYQAVEYLESTNTQYIDTGIMGRSGLDIYVKFQAINPKQARMMAASSGQIRLGLLLNSRNGAIANQYGTMNASLNDYICDNQTVYTLENDDGKLYFNGTLVDETTPQTFSLNKNLYLFASNSINVTPGYVRIFEAFIKKNGVLLLNCIPCRRKSDNVLGMYDLVSQTFLTNNGTDTFIAGQDIDDIEIYADGTQETVNITNGGTANAEMLLKVGTYQDNQELLTGNITRNVGVKVFDGTEDWVRYSAQIQGGGYLYYSDNAIIGNSLNTPASNVLSTHFIGADKISAGDFVNGEMRFQRASSTGFASSSRIYLASSYTSLSNFKAYLAEQYANGTPVIVVYPLATSTTETVTGQSLTASGNCTVTATGSLNNLELEASYKSGTGATLISFSNTTGYATKSYVDGELINKQDTLVSGTNIKTINNQSILGSGNIDIQGGADVEAFTAAEVQTIWNGVS